MENVLGIIVLVLIIGAAGYGMYLYFKEKRKIKSVSSVGEGNHYTTIEPGFMPFIRTMKTVFKHKDGEAQKRYLENNKYKIEEYEMKYGFLFLKEYNSVIEQFGKI